MTRTTPIQQARCVGEPQLSVVVCITTATPDALVNCLEAIESGAAGIALECIVPYDDRLDDVARLAEQFPWATFIDARREVNREKYGPLTHEHHHALRSVGLRVARGRIIAMVEDHGPPTPDWCRAVLDAHEQDSAAVIGGAVENGLNRPLNWATYFCDFGRYQNPVPSGPVSFVTDVNISYKRDALLSVRPLWINAYHEPEVNFAIAANGGGLRLHPRMVTLQRRPNLTLTRGLSERFVWGRSFAGTRVTQVSTAHRCALAAGSFLLPLVRIWRMTYGVTRRRRFVARFIASLPLILPLEIAWALGEFAGYVTGRPDGRPPRSDGAENCLPVAP